MAEQQEKSLTLPQGRTLSYSDAGNRDSKTIVIFFHGACSIGDASHPSPVLLKHDVHYIAPTLPGWGKSSPRPSPRSTPYYASLIQDVTALLEHLHPGCSNATAGEYKIYVTGGSFGTVPAQMIFNASKDVFPAREHIVACLLLAPLSPFKYHEGYAKHLTWGNYIAVGPASRFLPRFLLDRLTPAVMRSKLGRVEDAEAFLRSLIFDHVGDEERVLFENWKKERGYKDGELERSMAVNMVKSVEKSWDGFLEIADVLHSDWGFKPEDVQKKPVLVVTSKEDKMAPEGLGKWLVEKYPGAKLMEARGGHIASLWMIDQIWAEFMKLGN